MLSSSLSFSVDDENSHLYHDEEDDEEEGADRGGGMEVGDDGAGRAHSAPVFSAGELLPISVETTLARDKQVGQIIFIHAKIHTETRITTTTHQRNTHGHDNRAKEHHFLHPNLCSPPLLFL